MTPIKQEEDNRLNVVDLFSGCGGFSYGFESAGFNVILGVDNDDVGLQTFQANHVNAEVLNADLSCDGIELAIQKSIKGQRVDVIIAGPPCQGFSLTGPRDQSDERNKLFYSVFKLAKRVKPKAIIIENVPGLAALYGGRAKDAILREFEKLGFSCNYKVLYAPDYGVPQIRKRVFFVGLSKELGHFEFPIPTHQPSKYVSCSEAISDLPELQDQFGNEEDRYGKRPESLYQRQMRANSKILFNHVGTRHSNLVISVISQVPEGGNYKHLPPGVGESRTFHEAWTRYHSQQPSRTVDTGHRNHFHYRLNRVPTVRENARLQSFPDSFRFFGSRTQQYRHVGNAVPPLLGFHIANKLKVYIAK